MFLALRMAFSGSVGVVAYRLSDGNTHDQWYPFQVTTDSTSMREIDVRSASDVMCTCAHA